MKREQFKNQINEPANMYMFSAGEYAGMVARSGERYVISVDDREWYGSNNNADEEREPRNMGDFKTVDELFDKFEVDGKKFAESVLPKIKELNLVYT